MLNLTHYGEIHIKSNYLTLVRMAIIKTSTNNKSWDGVKEWEPSYTVDGNLNWYKHHGGQHECSLKT